MAMWLSLKILGFPLPNFEGFGDESPQLWQPIIPWGLVKTTSTIDISHEILGQKGFPLTASFIEQPTTYSPEN